MEAVYFILCVLIVREIIRRRIDFLSIAAASFILYTSNCLIGSVWVPQSGYNAYESVIHFETYVLIYTQLLILLFFLRIKKGHKKIILFNNIIFNRSKPLVDVAYDNKLYWTIILFFSGGTVIYNLLFVITLSTFFSYTHKVEIFSEISIMFGLAIWGALISFFYYYIKQNKIAYIVSAAFILLSFILGSRAYIATSLVGILIIKSFGWDSCCNKDVKDNIVRNKKIITLGIAMLVFLIVYKLIYQEMRAGDIASVLEILGNQKTWMSIFDIDELRIVCADYNYIIENQIQLPITDVIVRVISVIPFANAYIPSENPLRFSEILQTDINTTYGLASNFWGECYAMGGPLFVFIMTASWIIAIDNLNYHVFYEKSPFLLTLVSYLSFYIHRLDWTQVVGCAKIVFLFYIVKEICDLIVYRKAKL